VAGFQHYSATMLAAQTSGGVAAKKWSRQACPVEKPSRKEAVWWSLVPNG
jgi:hypothetical protein